MHPRTPTSLPQLGSPAGGKVTRASHKRRMDSENMKEEAPVVDADEPSLKKPQHGPAAATAAASNAIEQVPADTIDLHSTFHDSMGVLPADAPDR